MSECPLFSNYTASRIPTKYQWNILMKQVFIKIILNLRKIKQMRNVGSIFQKQGELLCQILKYAVKFQQLSVLLAGECANRSIEQAKHTQKECQKYVRLRR